MNINAEPKASRQMPNVIDKVVRYFNPQAALRREQARVAMDYISNTRRFDGASNTSRFEQWRRPGTDANSSILPSLPRLRNAARDLTRNNPWAENATRVIINNTVGAGITGTVALPVENVNRQKNLQNLWWNWAETTEIDASGQLDLAGLLALAMTTIVESGEVIIRRRYRRASAGLTIPVQIQVLEPDYLDETKDGDLGTGGYIRGGIEYSPRGEITHYWLREIHPGDQGGMWSSITSFRIRASEIIHAFDPKRAGQGRGYPWCAAAIRRLKDFDDYEDAQLTRQKLAACFVGMIHDMATPAGATGLEKTGPTEDQKDYFQPGMMELLPPGKDIKFSSPPGVTNYKEYGVFNLRGAAAAFGITYEAMTGDYSNVNYSSSRMGWLEMNRNFSRWQHTILRVQILNRIGAWFFGGLTISGIDSQGAFMKWTPPKREMMDPTKEVPAAIKAIRGGLTSMERYHSSMGNDFTEVMTEIEASNKVLDAKKIILDTDPRNVNMSGGLNEPADDEPPPQTA